MGPFLFAENLPGDDIGVMLHGGDEHLVPGSNLGPPVGLSYEVDGLGGAANEDDLPLRPRIDVAARLHPGVLIGLGRPLAELVDAAVDVRIVLTSRAD